MFDVILTYMNKAFVLFAGLLIAGSLRAGQPIHKPPSISSKPPLEERNTYMTPTTPLVDIYALPVSRQNETQQQHESQEVLLGIPNEVVKTAMNKAFKNNPDRALFLKDLVLAGIYLSHPIGRAPSFSSPEGKEHFIKRAIHLVDELRPHIFVLREDVIVDNLNESPLSDDVKRTTAILLAQYLLDVYFGPNYLNMAKSDESILAYKTFGSNPLSVAGFWFGALKHSKHIWRDVAELIKDHLRHLVPLLKEIGIRVEKVEYREKPFGGVRIHVSLEDISAFHLFSEKYGK